MTPSNLSRFHSKYSIDTDSECWEWTGRLNEHGYGVFVVGHATPRLAHRTIFEHMHGSIPSGLVVMHVCDNRRCVNPDHLRLGTQADNVQDMMQKCRHVSVGQPGSSNPAAKLNERSVEEIRKLYSNGGITMERIAKRFGVCQATVSTIVNYKRWRT